MTDRGRRCIKASVVQRRQKKCAPSVPPSSYWVRKETKRLHTKVQKLSHGTLCASLMQSSEVALMMKLLGLTEPSAPLLCRRVHVRKRFFSSALESSVGVSSFKNNKGLQDGLFLMKEQSHSMLRSFKKRNFTSRSTRHQKKT